LIHPDFFPLVTAKGLPEESLKNRNFSSLKKSSSDKFYFSKYEDELKKVPKINFL